MSPSRNLRNALLGAMAMVLAVAVSACTWHQGGAAPRGHLVIVGGGLRVENAEVFERMIELAGDGRIGVVPTASGVPESSGPSAVERINTHGGEDRAFLIDIRHDTPGEATNPERVREILSCSGLFFTGGVQTRIVQVFRPETGDTTGYAAVRTVLDRGGVIAGTSAGAAMMSDPMIQGGTSRAALRHGLTDEDDADRGIRVGKGMGFFPYGLSGQHFMTRGRMGRMVVALEATGLERGYGVEDNRAFHVDLATGVIEALGGPRSVLVVDIAGMKREGPARHNIRLSLLHSNDLADGNSGRITPAAIRKPFVYTRSATADIPETDDIWSRHAVPDIMVQLIMDGAEVGVGYDDHFKLTFSADEETKCWIGPDNDAAGLTISRMRLDIEPRQQVAAEQ